MSLILIATDDSAGAGRAIDYAARRAKTEGLDLMIVNVVGKRGTVAAGERLVRRRRAIRS